MADTYCVLLGDVVTSRKIRNREEFQSILYNACVKASDKYGGDFLADIKILKGTDEVGAVLYSWKHVFRIINIILEEVYPHQIRFSLVKGVVDVGVDSGDVAKMDGPAFHSAVQEINKLKQNGLMFSICTENKAMDRSISTQVCLLFLLRQYWNKRQYEIFCEYNKNISQKTIAEKMNISQQAVSKSLQQTTWKQYHILEHSIHEQFDQAEKEGG